MTLLHSLPFTSFTETNMMPKDHKELSNGALSSRDINYGGKCPEQESLPKTIPAQDNNRTPAPLSGRPGTHRSVKQCGVKPNTNTTSFPATQSKKDSEEVGFKTPEAEKDRSESVLKPPSPGTPRSVPERVINGNKTLIPVGGNGCRIFTDHQDLLPFGLAQASPPDEFVSVTTNLEKLKVAFVTSVDRMDPSAGVAGAIVVHEAEGQGCFVNLPDGRVVLTTAKHNFCKDLSVKGLIEECTSVYFVDVRGNKCVSLKSEAVRFLMQWDATKSTEEEISLRSGAGWKYGHDIAVIPLSAEHLLELHVRNDFSRAFDAVTSDFEIKVGMRVGIMACSASDNKMLAEGMQEGFPNWNYEPQRCDTFITVGEITYVGEKHVEYKVNTVPGFSGAPVFLLPDDTEDESHMKLIANHAGFLESLGTNFGFLVAPVLEQLESEGSI
jgi:hypothetical protein